MDFLLKKIISVFLMPLSIGLILLFLGLVYLILTDGKKGKGFVFLSFLWICLVAYSPFSNSLTKPLEEQYKAYLDIDPKIKYVLVLGNGHTTNEQISQTSQLNSTALFRLTEGIRILNQLEGGTLITSGYAGSDETPHAIISKKAAISLGVKDENIIPLPNPRDTKEEALAIKKLLDNDEKFVLVTSATHMPRAMDIFNSVGLNPIPAPTNFLVKEEASYLSVPKGNYLTNTEKSVHEYLGSMWHFIVQKVTSFLN